MSEAEAEVTEPPEEEGEQPAEQEQSEQPAEQEEPAEATSRAGMVGTRRRRSRSPSRSRRPTPPPTRQKTESPRPQSTQGALLELVIIVVLALGLALGIQAFIVKPYQIPSESMEPTLDVGQRVLVNRFIYHFTDPKIGDIVVFHPPAGSRGRRREGAATRGPGPTAPAAAPRPADARGVGRQTSSSGSWPDRGTP